MASGRTYEANAVITASDRASKIFNRIGRNAKRMGKHAAANMRRTMAVAARASKVGAVAVGTGFAFSIKRAADFEDKMADVRKVMEFETPEGFQNLSNELIEMSKKMPNTASDLAEIAAVAGQSGTAMEDLTRFTELSAKAATAFGMSAGDTATALASIREQLSLTQTELERNADVTNALANNMNATEGQLLDYNKRVAANGKMAGFANDETQAFGAAMIATGAEANVAATSFRNMTKTLTAGGSATKKQRTAFKKLGLDSKQVAKDMQKNAVGTVIDLLERLEKLPEDARGAMALDLFGSEARALTPLIENIDVLRKALGIVKDEAKVGNAVNKEYATRLQTTTEQAKIFRNRLDALLIKVGSKALPAINRAFEPIASGIEKSVDFMIDKMEEFDKFLDGFFTGLGFEGGTSEAMASLAKQINEIFGGDGETDRGEQLGKAFHSGQLAGEALLPVVEELNKALTTMSDFDLPDLDFGITPTMVTNLFAYAAAMTAINIPLKLLTGMKLTPIRTLIRLMGKLAAMAVGLNATADALGNLGDASGGRGKKSRAKKPRGRGSFIKKVIKGAGGLAMANPGTAAVAAGVGGAIAFDEFAKSDGEKARRNRLKQEALIERQRQLNDIDGYDANGMPRYRFGGAPQPQTGGGADRRDTLDPRTRFPSVKDQLEMTPAGKVSAEITGDVTAEIQGKADVNVHLRVTGPAQVTGATVSGTGNINPSVGTDTTGASE